MADPTDEDTSYRELLKDRDALTQQVSALQAELARVREETKSAFLTGARMMEERDAARAKLAEVERSLSGEMAASAELTRQLDCARGWERRNFKRANSLESQLAAYRTVVEAAHRLRSTRFAPADDADGRGVTYRVHAAEWERLEEALDAMAPESDHRVPARSIEELIDASSLGGPEAKALRESADPALVQAVLARTDELSGACLNCRGTGVRYDETNGHGHQCRPCQGTGQALDALPAPSESVNSRKDTNDMPKETFSRRIQIDKLTPAERAIYDAMVAVEGLPPDVRLTDAVVLLQQARDKVADYVDGIER
jgi:hypothetical protein